MNLFIKIINTMLIFISFICHILLKKLRWNHFFFISFICPTNHYSISESFIVPPDQTKQIYLLGERPHSNFFHVGSFFQKQWPKILSNIIQYKRKVKITLKEKNHENISRYIIAISLKPVGKELWWIGT